MSKSNKNKTTKQSPNAGTGDMAAPPEIAAPPAPEPVKMVKKIITCSRCKGDGFWHTSATGRRLQTISGPVIDTEKTCPKCRSAGKTHVMITEDQLIAEKAAAQEARQVAKAEIDAAARAAKKAIDEG